MQIFNPNSPPYFCPLLAEHDGIGEACNIPTLTLEQYQGWNFGYTKEFVASMAEKVCPGYYSKLSVEVLQASPTSSCSARRGQKKRGVGIKYLHEACLL